MASYNELNALIDAYINRNGVQAITGQILNGVLKAMVEQLGRGYTIMGVATPSTNPGTPDAPESWFASTPGTYTNFGGLEVADAEFALQSYTPSGEVWTKTTLTEGIQEVSASIDGNVGTPEVTAEYINGGLIFTFSNMKGQTGDAAGFGTVNATVDGNIGTPGVSVNTSGPDTAKNITFQFTNLKGETGVTSCVVTVDNTTGTPSCAVSLVGQELHLDFTGLKGAQGNTGSSVDYPFEIVNNLTTNDATKALSAAMGVQLESEVSQLEAKVDEIVDEYINTPLSQSGTTRYYIKTDVAVGETVDLTEVMSGSYANFKHYIEDCAPGDVFIINGTGTAPAELWCFIDSSNKKISSSGGVAGSDLSKTAPAGAAKIIINDRTGNGTQYKRAKGLLAQINDELDQHDAAISSMQSEVSNVGTELVELEHKVGTNNYDNAEFSASYLLWATSSNVVVASSSSYANQRILVPIAVQEGDTVNITQEVYGEAKKAIFADSSDNVIAEVTYQGSVTNYIVPPGATRLYINRKYSATFSCRIQSAYSVKLDSIVNASELPIYAPLPQVAADGQNGSLDAENSTSTDIYNAIDAAIANYGSYAFGEVLGKDATNTYDIKRYAFCRADLFAWRASGPFYAWETGGVTYYIESCSPHAGMDIYDAARENVVATVASYGAASGTMKDTNNQQYTRKSASNIAPDIIYTIREVFTFDYDIYTKAGTVVTRLSKTTWDSDTNTISYNSKSYIRSRVDDWGRNTKATIVLWANEHAAQSDPHEPAIVCYRLIRDLCQSGPSGNKFLSFLKNFCKVLVIPVVNPYGLNNYAVSKNTAGRLNGNGVNLNRNYPTVGWTQGSGVNYGGAYGGSEIEVQYVINTCIEFGANVGIDIHCLGYTTEANEGVCAYGGNNMISSDAGKKDIDRVINSMLSDFSIKLQNYGEASSNGNGEGKNWLLANGIEGGLIEMNAGPYALQYDGKQHSGFILGADYTLLLRLLNLWNKRYNEDLALSNFEIS